MEARPVFRRPRLSFAGNILIAAGALLLLRLGSHIATGVRGQSETILPATSAAVDSRPLGAVRPAEGQPLGRLEVPRLGIDLVVFEGTSESTLRKGPGHLSSTPWPGSGATGNCVIAGHRDSFFRRLAKARQDDVVRWHGPSGTSTYRLAKRRIVRPEDLSVIAPAPDPRLTLITCFPFDWTGSAPYRLAWSAVPVGSERPSAHGPAVER